jgi:hypothetical protein
MQTESENKRYDAARTHAAEAVSLAERAMVDGRLGAVRAMENAEIMLSNLRTDIEDTERNVNSARYSQLDLDYNVLEREIADIHNAADRAQTSHAEGRHQDAIDIARDIRFNLSNINDRVANAAVAGKK